MNPTMLLPSLTQEHRSFSVCVMNLGSSLTLQDWPKKKKKKCVIEKKKKKKEQIVKCVSASASLPEKNGQNVI
jgi:hypothetical protein